MMHGVQSRRAGVIGKDMGTSFNTKCCIANISSDFAIKGLIMSKQLSLSAVAAVFSMALFALASTTFDLGDTSANQQAANSALIGFDAQN